MRTYIHTLSYLAHFFSDREMLQGGEKKKKKKVVDKIKTHILSSVTVFRKSYRL